jgi:hypothetical protein
MPANLHGRFEELVDATIQADRLSLVEISLSIVLRNTLLCARGAES